MPKDSLNLAVFKLLILRGQMYDCFKHLQLTITVLNTRIGKHMAENLSVSRNHKLGQIHLAFLIHAVTSEKNYWAEAEVNYVEFHSQH